MAKAKPKKQPTTKPDVAGPFRNRIVGHGEESPDQLLANEKNWRIHPYTQQKSLTAVLEQVGYVQSVIVNKRLGKAWPTGQRGVETMVDGHMRVEVAISKGQPKVPVLYVDLDPSEEAKVLAAFDPISGMAGVDAAKLDELLRDVETGSEDLSKMLADLAGGELAGNGETELKQLDTKPPPRMSWVLIGIPTIRFGEISPMVERLAVVDGVLLETTSNDG